jgi:hypothetical protein
MSCGIFPLTGPPYFPQRGTIVDCRTSLANIGSGALLIGRGVLDITAAPFVVVGNLLSGGCRYEVIAHCPEISFRGPAYQVVDPCCSVSTSGCHSCSNGHFGNGHFGNGHFGNGYIIEDGFSHNRTHLSQPMQRRNTSVIQAAHREPMPPGVRFVQPR